MKLLIVTQKVNSNDPILGFFHRWIEEFSKYREVIVIALEVGEHRFSENVQVYGLGKKSGTSKFTQAIRFLGFIMRHRKEYKEVFVHMNPIYILLGGWFWRLYGKSIGLWYVHSHVDWRLRIAEKFVCHIFTANKESFRLRSEKVFFVGHGIDTELFLPGKKESLDKRTQIITVGRISRTKRIDVLIEALKESKNKGMSHYLKVIGSPITTEDKIYEKELQALIEAEDVKDHVELTGPVVHSCLPKIYQDADLFINLSKTGSLDKAVLEAMACNVPVLTSNEAFFEVLPKKYLVSEAPDDIVKAIETLVNDDAQLRDIIIQNYSLDKLIGKILNIF